MGISLPTQRYNSLPTAANLQKPSSDNSDNDSNVSVLYFVVQIQQKTNEHVDWKNLAWYKQKDKAYSAAEIFKQQHPHFDIRVMERS